VDRRMVVVVVVEEGEFYQRPRAFGVSLEGRRG
jgi:hypothetical protein